MDEPVDALFRRLYDERLGDAYWPPERRHVENGYRDLPFPFEPISDVPRFTMRLDWTLAQYLAYLRSWSASQKYQRETGRDALTGLVDDFTAAWGDPALTRSVSWPLSLRAGRTPED